ncbi:Glyoxalase/Bleomycin resistance protein/Dihydroxybiphenyl dioxygenase [Aspergillus bertholletiae]|uniref:Glyoxalase/Bleomycin resistance protein/Dihydroxybiphenyl dioxygenase n=1 Tax=Aspergillus bertholletiae TaxID=1226010 RepID=A0A5N7B642_9EURO|nr:Glyoxalase/Bleomycin resistance protein/Dihydroxybiphenyl dioxygenase [Aspergillus bertholletiae]
MSSMITSVTPFLMFEGDAEAALSLYVQTIPGSNIISITRYGPGEAGTEGKVSMARANIGGVLEVMATDSYVKHAFNFTPSLSLFVNFKEEHGDGAIDRVVSTLSEGGSVLMPLDNYGFSRRFAWVNDRFGVSWQLNLT